jgi:hypothetical protein
MQLKAEPRPTNEIAKVSIFDHQSCILSQWRCENAGKSYLPIDSTRAPSFLGHAVNQRKQSPILVALVSC